MKVLISTAGALVLCAMAATARDGSQSLGDPDTIAAGRLVYMWTCASCHGGAATGFGPAASVLLKPPPDLTRFSDRLVPFPADAIRSVITGHIRRDVGPLPLEMPKWRTSLDAKIGPGDLSEMDALLAYLESIQLRKFGPYMGASPRDLASVGAGLFKSHCVVCHAESGRGPAPSGYIVGILPDLTTIAARNGGAFELRRVFESIAGCDDDKTTDMPAWRRAFKRAGWGDYLTTKNLEALATYIESIQR